MERPDYNKTYAITHKYPVEDYIKDLELYCSEIEKKNNALIKQVFSLHSHKRFLEALEAAGVDNWEGYEEAQRIFKEGEN
jgi:hypothetical protein